MTDNLRVKKFMDGTMTPTEAHRKLAFGGHKCDKCGNPAAIRVRTFAEQKEVMKRSPQWVMLEAAKNEGRLPVVDFIYGKFIRVGQAFACEQCATDLEKEAAKAPSWCIVEVDRGIPDKIQLQVPVQYQQGEKMQ